MLWLPLAPEISRAGRFFPRAESVSIPQDPPLHRSRGGLRAGSCWSSWNVPAPSQGATCRSPSPVTRVPKYHLKRGTDAAPGLRSDLPRMSPVSPAWGQGLGWAANGREASKRGTAKGCSPPAVTFSPDQSPQGWAGGWKRALLPPCCLHTGNCPRHSARGSVGLSTLLPPGDRAAGQQQEQNRIFQSHFLPFLDPEFLGENRI